MRRFALKLLASLSLAALCGCAGYGGSAIGGGDSSSYDRLIFSTLASGFEGVYLVAPSANTPLVVSVYGSKYSFSITQFNTTATWATTYAAPPTTYHLVGANLIPIDKACPAIPPGSVNPSAALVVFNGAQSVTTYTSGTFYQTIGIFPPNLAGAPASYCLNVVATASNGTIGSFVAFVGNSP